MEIIVLKILLWILLAIFCLLLLVCLFNVKITVGSKDRFYYKLSVGGIRINPERFMHKKQEQAKDKQKKGKQSKGSAQKQSAQKKGKQKKKPSPASVISLVTNIAKTAARVLPKGFRIRLRHLNITVGGEDAAQVALDYGKYYAILSTAFALFDGYRGLFYGFRAKRDKVTLQTDYLSGKTTAEFELTVSFFIWQLLFSGIRIGVAAIREIIKAETEPS